MSMRRWPQPGHRRGAGPAAPRIGACLTTFNRAWSRRVLGQGAVVLLITDGLDRDPGAELGTAMQRLALSARAVIWLNPLLRWDGFALRARGIGLKLPHVTSVRAGHDIASPKLLGGRDLVP